MAKHPLGVESTYSAPAQEQLLCFTLHGAQFTLPKSSSHTSLWWVGKIRGFASKFPCCSGPRCEYKSSLCIDISAVFSSHSLCATCRKDRSDREVALWSQALLTWSVMRSSQERSDSEGVLGSKTSKPFGVLGPPKCLLVFFLLLKSWKKKTHSITPHPQSLQEAPVTTNFCRNICPAKTKQ